MKKNLTKKIFEHNKHITTRRFSNLTTEKFSERLKPEKLAIKDNIADFIKITYFYEKLININKKLLQIKQNKETK